MLKVEFRTLRLAHGVPHPAKGQGVFLREGHLNRGWDEEEDLAGWRWRRGGKGRAARSLHAGLREEGTAMPTGAHGGREGEQEQRGYCLGRWGQIQKGLVGGEEFQLVLRPISWWVNKTGYLHTIEYYFIIKKKWYMLQQGWTLKTLL